MKTRNAITRRGFLGRVGAGVAVTAVPAVALEESCSAAPPETSAAEASVAQTSETMPVTLHVNGTEHRFNLEPRTTLANALRYHLGLTGTKIVCDRGSCGACTVIANGRTVYSCMMLAADAQGREIRTVEGLGSDEHLSPVQAAFVQRDALMCGFCTPGFVVSCSALLQKNPHPTEDEVREAVRGNLCRCGTYPRIFEACLEASGQHQT